MKQGTLILRVIMLVLFFGVLAYFGVYIWNSLTDNTATAALYTYTAEERLESKGYFFRDEVTLSQHSELAELLCAEGEKVGAGDPVARIYSSAEGYQLQQELDEARSTLDSLKYILSRTGEAAETVALDDEIVDTFTGLRSSVSAGRLGKLSDEADELRSLIFRRDYSYNGNDTLTQQIDAAQARVDELAARASSAYETVTAPAAGLYSAAVDGFEGVLTLEALEGLTPSGLTRLAGAQQSAAAGSVGKIITSSGWYFACNLSTEQCKNLYKGANVTLRFADSGRDFPAQVLRVSDEENGLVTVTFHAKEYAPQLTALRNQSVSIITSQATGFRVPKRAVRVNEDGALGVYRVSGAQASWVEVTILWEEEDYYLIAQAPKLDEEGNQAEQTTMEKAARLRDGDTIVVKGEAMHDGKVVAG